MYYYLTSTIDFTHFITAVLEAELDWKLEHGSEKKNGYNNTRRTVEKNPTG